MWEKSCLCYVVCLQNCHTSSLLFVLWIFKTSLSNKFHLKNVLGFLRKRFIIWIKTENGNDKFLSMCLLIWRSSLLFVSLVIYVLKQQQQQNKQTCSMNCWVSHKNRLLVPDCIFKASFDMFLWPWYCL